MMAFTLLFLYQNPNYTNILYIIIIILINLGEIGAVRLINGLGPEQGIVEICLNGSWFRLCGRYWSYWNTLVVCRQLGYPATKAGKYKVSHTTI